MKPYNAIKKNNNNNTKNRLLLLSDLAPYITLKKRKEKSYCTLIKHLTEPSLLIR